jgi:signal transduction histidine kinase
VNLRSEILPLLAQSYLLTNQLKKASEYVDEGLRYSREHNNKLGILKSLNVAGDLNIKKENLDTAEKQLLEAYKLAKNMNNKAELLYNLKLNTSLDSTRQFFEEAFNWQNQYLKLKQDIDIEAKAKAKIIFDKNTPPDEQTLAPVSSLTSQNSNSFLTYGLILTLIMILVLLSLSYIKVSRDNKLLKIYSEESKDLILKNNRLEELNQVKDKLFSIVSHDLKDSISSIKALLDLLKDDGITQQEFNDLIPELSENANNASSLLFNLLNWSKSQMQNLQPKPELFNIQEVFQIKTALIEKKIEDKGIILIDESRRDFVFADRSMLEIVIQNLITNAVKFSGKGDVITISNQDYNGKVLICVEDTGIGISKENIKKLFNAKKTFTTIGTENEKGTGLGLTICKDLVELNKGRIWVESTQNIGSKFFIELPKAALTD